MGCSFHRYGRGADERGPYLCAPRSVQVIGRRLLARRGSAHEIRCPLVAGVFTLTLVAMLTLIVVALVFVSASDGDTLTVRDGNVKTILRLAEVDAPERTQPFSQISRRNLVVLCKDAKAIEVQPVSLDRFGRTVAMVTCDGVVVNWRQVHDGLAWCFTK
jgi:endonuclease YncB( thermonuclease family)